MSIETLDRPVEQQSLEPTDLIDEDGNIVLTAAEWHNIQAYVEHGLGLPTTEAAFRHELQIEKAETYEPFKKLRGAMIKAYSGVHENCFNWKNSTYPSVVELADDIVSYSRKSESAYQLLRTESARLGDTAFDRDNKAHAMFLDLIEKLVGEAQLRQQKAASVRESISDFRAKMQENRKKLDGVTTDAKEDYAALEKRTKEIGDAVKELNEQLVKCWKVYNKDIVVLATSPLYATGFVWPLPPIPVGLIAAVIVDTIHAIELDKMKRRINEVHKLLAAQNEELRRDSLLMIRYSGAKEHVSNFVDELDKVAPVVAKVEGVWRSIAVDLKDVAQTLQGDKAEEDELWRAVDLGAVELAWKTVKNKADFWRQAAFIEVSDQPLTDKEE